MLFGKKQKLKQADGIPDYHIAPSYNGEGAGAFVMNPEFALPVVSFRGRGRMAGSMRVLQHPQVVVAQVAQVAGIPTQAGQFDLTRLSRENDGSF